MSETKVIPVEYEKEAEELIYTKEEDAVKALLSKLKKIKVEKDVAIGSLLLQLQELQDEIHIRALPYDHESEKYEAEITALMPAIARTIKTDAGAANWRKGSVRVSYDYRALDAINDEYVKQVVLPFRKQTEVAANVSVEVY